MKTGEHIVKIFRALAQNPSPSGARILLLNSKGDHVSVVSSWSQRNLERGKNSKFQQTHLADLSSQYVKDFIPVDISNEQLSAISLSEDMRAVLRDFPSEAVYNQRKQYLEIWQHRSLYRNFDLSALDVHGDVYVDDEFGSLEWSPSESKVVFVAEKKQPKTEPFYKPKPQESKENGSEQSKPPQKGEDSTFRQDWGELLVGKHQPVVVVCDLVDERLTVLEGIPSNVSPGQVIWTPDGLGIIGVAFNNEPRRLGITYCTNRESVIFHLTLDGQYRVLSPGGHAVRSPRFSPDGQYLVWMDRPADGPHHACHRLISYRWDTGKTDVVIDIVQESIETATGTPFYGFFSQKLPQRCWASDSSRILFHTPQNCQTVPFVVDVETGKLVQLDILPEYSQGSAAILDVRGDYVVALRTSLREPAALFIGRLRSSGEEEKTVWMPLTSWAPNVDLINTSVEYLNLEQKYTSDKVRKFSAIYFGPKGQSDGSVPLIVAPHGGPNSTYTDEFSLTLGVMVLLGYGVVLVNYRGSTGFGQASVNFLMGRIGDADVKDCKLAQDEALKRFPCLNPSRCVLFGGSHGGFLVTHLSGQYPDAYRAVVARNPVIDVASMSVISDIPDWTFSQAGIQYDPSGNPVDGAMEKMRRLSPIEHVAKVKSPTLLMLGKKDLRVPYSQGLAYYYALHAHGVTTKAHVYDDVHSLSQVSVEMDNIINSLLWFEQHLA